MRQEACASSLCKLNRADWQGLSGRRGATTRPLPGDGRSGSSEAASAAFREGVQSSN